MYNNRKLKSIIFSMALAAGMLLPMGASAQNDDRRFGLFGLDNLSLFEEPEPTVVYEFGGGANDGMVGANQGVAISDYSVTPGGIFGITRSIFRTNSDNGNSRELFGISSQVSFANFGETEPDPTAPLGSGLAILIGAGLGYVALKKKEDKQ